MRKSAKILFTTAGGAALVLGSLAIAPVQTATAADEASPAEQGKAISFDRKKGNCIACHKMGDGDQPGNIGPELVHMKARYPDKPKLRAQIWDATTVNPNTIMPPFGKHKILTEKEVDLVTEFIYTL